MARPADLLRAVGIVSVAACFAAAPAFEILPLPGSATKSCSGSLADMTRSGHLDIVLSNEAPDPKLVLVNHGAGRFSVGGTYGDPKWPTRNAATTERCTSNAVRCAIPQARP